MGGTVRREGLEPPEPDGTPSTAGPAPSYGLPPRASVDAEQGAGFEPAWALRRWFCRPAPSAAREPLRVMMTAPFVILREAPRALDRAQFPSADRRIFCPVHVIRLLSRNEPGASSVGGRFTSHGRADSSLVPRSEDSSWGVRIESVRTLALSHSFHPVRPEGLEPPTSGSVIRRSIQLSYGRIPQNDRGWDRTSILRVWNPALCHLSFTALSTIPKSGSRLDSNQRPPGFQSGALHHAELHGRV
jgi:hypothetical protein